MELLLFVLDFLRTLFPGYSAGLFVLGTSIGFFFGFFFGSRKNDGKIIEMLDRHQRELREADLRHAEELRRADERHHDEMADLRKRAGARIARLERELSAERDPTGKTALMGIPRQGEWDSAEDDEDSWL